jgi:hypothetical protein
MTTPSLTTKELNTSDTPNRMTDMSRGGVCRRRKCGSTRLWRRIRLRTDLEVGRCTRRNPCGKNQPRFTTLQAAAATTSTLDLMATPAVSNATVISRFYDKVASENLAKASLFAAPLNTFMDEQKKKMPFLNVPWIVRKCCDYLHAHGTFRSHSALFGPCSSSQISNTSFLTPQMHELTSIHGIFFSHIILFQFYSSPDRRFVPRSWKPQCRNQAPRAL